MNRPRQGSQPAATREPAAEKLKALALGKVLKFHVLNYEDHRRIRRRLAVTFAIDEQIGLPPDTKSFVLRFNGISRVFGHN